MICYSSKQFLDEYELQLDKEFDYDGQIAQWAPGHDGPRFWGEEDELIELKDDDTVKGNIPTSAAAMTSDGRYLAVSTNAVIRVYDIESLALRSELVGHQSNVQSLFFVNAKEAGHRLVSSAGEVSGADDKVHVWSIDADGRLSKDQRAMPIAVDKMAGDAAGAIETDLQGHHDLNEKEIDAIRNGFADTLKIADALNRIKNVPSMDGGVLGFGTQPISHDGAKLMLETNGQTTQQGMRPPEELPQIVIVDAATQEEQCRLKGHEDAIMWAGWSLDDKTIATACWDETFRLWNAETGECKHVVGKTKGQNWAGAFLPDGKHVLLSGGQPVEVGIYDIETTEKVTHLETPSPTKLDSWMRYFTVHPKENLIVLQNARTLLAWRPFSSSPSPDVQEIFALTRDEEDIKNSYGGIYTLKWVDEGKKLLAQASDQTTFVWDMRKGWKWRFQRPKGWKVESSNDVFFVKRKGAEWVVALDADGKVRFWKL